MRFCSSNAGSPCSPHSLVETCIADVGDAVADWVSIFFNAVSVAACEVQPERIDVVNGIVPDCAVKIQVYARESAERI